MDNKDVMLAAELLSAVQYQEELGKRHRAEIIAARDRLNKAALGLLNMSDEEARRQLIGSVYARAFGVKKLLATMAGFFPNCRARDVMRLADGKAG